MAKPSPSPGPFRVDHVREEGDRYELEDGHPVYCAPAGGHHAKATARGAQALGADPSVEQIGIDAGYTEGDKDLRAPDIAIGNVPDVHGWAHGAPRLAVEYTGRGQDEEALQRKVSDLLARGCELVWVARLLGPRRVEVHAPQEAMKTVNAGEILHAPGILQNPVAVDALFDDRAALEATLVGLLNRQGYASLDAVRAEGRLAGRREGLIEALVRLLERRFGPLSAAAVDRVNSADSEMLARWMDGVLDAPSLEALLER